MLLRGFSRTHCKCVTVIIGPCLTSPSSSEATITRQNPTGGATGLAGLLVACCNATSPQRQSDPNAEWTDV